MLPAVMGACQLTMSICCTVATSGNRYLSGLLVKDMALCFSKKACRNTFRQTAVPPLGAA